MARLSGLQRDVLSLYRKCLREIRNKPEVGYIKPHLTAEFQKHLSVNKKDFSTVEYLLRKGNRQLELYATPGIRNIR
ncbi:Complex 1 LYR protein [Penicillium vulpinum]|uniref:Complex 1 LYR protein n=1 Tax=Penicillium vulpinum TaxID=29845 RepID=UPI00254777D7|nr:Complex 1 LYR protein [Penicillium vulpinum]KAJ5961070.1 Complex 1 LYR protein [Penicillium vulpinum]